MSRFDRFVRTKPGKVLMGSFLGLALITNGCGDAEAVSSPTTVEGQLDPGVGAEDNDKQPDSSTIDKGAPGFDDGEENSNDLPSPESFIDKIEKWGHEDVKYIGQRTLSNNVEVEYVYESKTSGGEVVWSTVIIGLGDGSFSIVYNEYKNPLG